MEYRGTNAQYLALSARLNPDSKTEPISQALELEGQKSLLIEYLISVDDLVYVPLSFW